MSEIIQISVIMPVYNETLSELNSSITSIQNQSFKDFEYVIIDDNPKNNKTKKFLISKSSNDSRIRLFFNKKNMGTVSSANKAISKSRGKFIARMDADDIASSNRLQNQLDFMKKNNLDISCCNFISFNKYHFNKIPSYCTKTQIKQFYVRRVMSFVNLAIGPTLFFKKKDINKINGYRHMLAEDYDLAARFLINRYKMGYLSEPLIYKRDRKDNLSSVKALQTYESCFSISKYLRKFHLAKIMPMKWLHDNINKITKHDIMCYHKYNHSCIKYVKNKSLMNLFKKYFFACSSILVLRNNIMVHFNKLLQNLLIS